MLDAWFGLREHGTTVRTEIVAGLSTFLTMVYIAFVNPSILAEAGMDEGAVFVATCLAAAIGSLIMGVYANYPVALAPGMGINAYFAYGIVLGMGHPWPAALGAVFLSGVLFVGLSLSPLREWIINAIPNSLKFGISAGIGLFLAVIGLQNAGIVVDHPVTLVALGDLAHPSAMLAIAGFVALAALHVLGIPGAIVIAILGITALAVLLGLTPATGVVAPPPSMEPTLFKLDIAAAMEIGFVAIIFAFLFVDLFDTAGTLVGVAERGGLLDAQGRLPRLKRALLADSLATTAGALLGTSTTTSYIESTAGVNAGGRTGLTAVVVAFLFLACLFLSPLAATVPAFATAPVLVFLGCLMLSGFARIDWEDLTEAVPAALTAITMPLTFSIATGLGFGFVAYALGKLLTGRAATLSPAILVVAALFGIKFALL